MPRKSLRTRACHHCKGRIASIAIQVSPGNAAADHGRHSRTPRLVSWALLALAFIAWMDRHR